MFLVCQSVINKNLLITLDVGQFSMSIRKKDINPFADVLWVTVLKEGRSSTGSKTLSPNVSEGCFRGPGPCRCLS